jgi:hypothetical protein
MTPKDKANELVDRMYFIISNNGQFTGVHSIPNKFTEAKKCALIAVDEIIKTLNYDIKDLDVRGNILLDLIKYWREVKQEIEKL